MGETIRLEEYLPMGNPSSVVLGCTHYVYLKEKISRFYGCKTYDGNDALAKRLADLLKNRDTRPLCPKNVCLKPLLTTFPFNKKFFQKKGIKTGEIRGRKSIRFRQIKNHLRLYFIGSGRLLNVNFYEQMFVFHKKY